MTNNIKRCQWCENDTIYTEYHDKEWGKHCTDENTLFEFLVLESAQAGLSWITILKRREGYKKLFSNFNPRKVSKFTQEDVDRIVLDPSIIRHRGKIEAAINNAKLFLDIQNEFGTFYRYLYSFMPKEQPINNSIVPNFSAPTKTKESDAIAKDMKKRGFKFFGTTICYAYMQAVGMVNDHIYTCSFK